MNIKKILFIGTILYSSLGWAQVKTEKTDKYWNLETEVPANWSVSRGELQTSSKHYKLGQASIAWDWKSGSAVRIDNPKGINEAFKLEKRVKKDLYAERSDELSDDVQKIGGFMGWIYNENPVDDYLVFEFGVDDKTALRFPYYLNFKGWRACWISFVNMKQIAEAESLNYMKIKAPQKGNGGHLFFDRFSFSNKPISPRATPDMQLPFINPKINHNHWGGQWYWQTKYKHDIPVEGTVTVAQKKAMEVISDRVFDIVKGVVPSQDENWYYKDHFNDLCIKRAEDGTVSGRPIVSADEYVALLNDLKPKNLGPVFLGLAKGYALSDDDTSKEMFFDLFDHFLDQGYDFGSATGTQHHFGYQFAGIPESFFLMKEAMEENGYLERAVTMLQYWYGLPEHRIDKNVNDLQGVADLWNTKIMPRLISVLMMRDTPEKVRELKALSRFLDNSLQYSSGLVGGITPDGSLFHHAGLYPAYMAGALFGVGPVVYSLSHTPFEIGTTARKNLRQSLFLIRSYSQKYDWPIGLSGRQVFAGKISQGVIDAMGYTAKAGDGNSEVNEAMAAAYMRLAQPYERMYQEFAAKGIKPENDPQGFEVVNYGCLGLHRRADWLVSVKGYNKYVWSGEIYTHDNRWGRYMSYGTVQINNSGEPVNGKSSGFDQDGWDWNRFPGATSIHLPLDKLKCPINSLMSRSDETFCGSSSLEKKNGIFGMKLHEKEKLKNFTPDHRARKSVFCFDDRIICLGSNIENSNKDYPTETTLFQLNVEKTDQAVEIDGSSKNGLFKEAPTNDDTHVLLDNKGNGYYIPKGQDLQVAIQQQESRHNKSERVTHGNFAVAWLNHGNAPKNGEYEYAIQVNSTANKMDAFQRAMLSKDPLYKVVQKDYNAHIVTDMTTGITGLVLFEAGKVNDELIERVNHEALIMKKKLNDNAVVMSVCSPSVNLASAKPYDNKGSVAVQVEVTLKGNWSVDAASGCKVVSSNKRSTVLSFECIHGQPVEVKLNKTRK
ncbi:hypothetical protein EYV94_05525 [Puteibacter caeruleilacunae]|nr:hypothetical protein EYV94_05525 [Puteibacter caeruleilacunae]